MSYRHLLLEEKEEVDTPTWAQLNAEPRVEKTIFDFQRRFFIDFWKISVQNPKVCSKIKKIIHSKLFQKIRFR